MCGLHAGQRHNQARHVCARAKNGPAAVRAFAVPTRRDVEVAPVRAAEAEARHERRGDREHVLEPAVGAEARDAAARAERDPHPARLVDGEAVGVAARHAREDAPVDAAPVVGEVVRQDDALAVARGVDGPAVGRAPVDAAVDRVAEVEVAGPVDPGRLHEAVAEGERLHRRGGTPGARAKQAWRFPELLAKMPAVPRREIQDLSCGELEAWCAAAGEPRYRATQILDWAS